MNYKNSNAIHLPHQALLFLRDNTDLVYCVLLCLHQWDQESNKILYSLPFSLYNGMPLCDSTRLSQLLFEVPPADTQVHTPAHCSEFQTKHIHVPATTARSRAPTPRLLGQSSLSKRIPISNDIWSPCQFLALFKGKYFVNTAVNSCSLLHYV